jgi:hypothetical protein
MQHEADTLATTPEALVENAYRLISFGPGGDPEWSAFRELFAEHCVLALRVFPQDSSVSVMTLDEYVHRQVREEMKTEGYTERPIDRRFSVTGDIAEARVTFEMVFGADEVYAGIDHFQLVRRNGHWLIVSIIGNVGART